MLSFGETPFLECSSKGDKRFSAFYAVIKYQPRKTIEEVYQAAKVFKDGTSGLTWKEAKGRRPVGFKYRSKIYSVESIEDFYFTLWWYYLEHNKNLIDVLNHYKGFSDIFGQEGHCCQAKAIYDYQQGRKPALENWVVLENI